MESGALDLRRVWMGTKCACVSARSLTRDRLSARIGDGVLVRVSDDPVTPEAPRFRGARWRSNCDEDSCAGIAGVDATNSGARPIGIGGDGAVFEDDEVSRVGGADWRPRSAN